MSANGLDADGLPEEFDPLEARDRAIASLSGVPFRKLDLPAKALPREREKTFDAIRFDYRTGYASREAFLAAREAYIAAGGKKLL